MRKMLGVGDCDSCQQGSESFSSSPFTMGIVVRARELISLFTGSDNFATSKASSVCSNEWQHRLICDSGKEWNFARVIRQLKICCVTLLATSGLIAPCRRKLPKFDGLLTLARCAHIMLLSPIDRVRFWRATLRNLVRSELPFPNALRIISVLGYLCKGNK